MRATIQRVLSASVTVDGKVKSEIEKGYLVYLGVSVDDKQNDAEYIINKIINLRVFPDNDDKLNLSLADVKGSILLISAFTLQADARKGRRPSFTQAAKNTEAQSYYELVHKELVSKNINVQIGAFGEDMKVASVNDGPICILLDSNKIF